MSTHEFTPGLTRKLKIAFQRTKWTTEQVDRLCQGDTLATVREDFVEEAKVFRPKFSLNIRVGEDRPLADLINKGDYTFVYPGLFMFIEAGQLVVATEPSDVRIVFLKFSKQVGIREVRNHIGRMGFQCPTAEDAIMVGDKYRHLGDDVFIIFPHRPWIDDLDRCHLTVLTQSGLNRSLTVCSYEDPWPNSYVFAARVQNDTLPYDFFSWKD
jgi:hypothetical protein